MVTTPEEYPEWERMEPTEKRIMEAYNWLQGYIVGANADVRALKQLDVLYIECRRYVDLLQGKILP